MASPSISELSDQIESLELTTEADIEVAHIRFLSKKQGVLTELLKAIPTLPPAERKGFGQQINQLKRAVEGKISAARENLAAARQAAPTTLDLSLPGRERPTGALHPIQQTLATIREIFAKQGFTVAEGPEIEDDWHNFTALNFPPEHPARDMQDTFFLPSGTGEAPSTLLRTHTSPVQVRVMASNTPPIRIIAPGRVYRNEAISYKSFCLFHQVEGLYVDTHVTFADLKHILYAFARDLFGSDVRLRFRPSFFPFTEPSAEVDIWWARPDHPEGGQWMEVLGCGMVDPEVLTSSGIDPERYTGYAFGMGVERLALLRYGIDDIRLLYENDLRLLDQFA